MRCGNDTLLTPFCILNSSDSIIFLSSISFLCGENDIEVLNINRIDGRRHRHREKVGGHIDSYLIPLNFPEGYCILYMNCQCKERKKHNQFNPHNKINFNQ